MTKPVNDALLRQQLDAKQAGGGTLTEGESTQLARLNRDGVSSESAAKTLADPEALATYANWQDGSVAKTALHGMIGLIEAKIGGGSAAAGALGAMSQEAMAPILSDYLKENGFVAGSDEYKSLLQLGATLVGTAVGALATGDVQGASTGANAAFVGVTNNFLTHENVDALLKAKAQCILSPELCQKSIKATYDLISQQNSQKINDCYATNSCAKVAEDIVGGIVQLSAVREQIGDKLYETYVSQAEADLNALAAAAKGPSDTQRAVGNVLLAGATVGTAVLLGEAAIPAVVATLRGCANNLAQCANTVGDLALSMTGALPTGLGVSQAERAVVAGAKGLSQDSVISALRNASGAEADMYARQLANMSTNASGKADRVVLGRWVENGGYIAEAKTNGGIWYETSRNFFSALTDGLSDTAGRAKAWSVNEQFLKGQLERGVGRIDLYGETIADVLINRPNSFTAMEVKYLESNAGNFGYIRTGNSWVKVR